MKDNHLEVSQVFLDKMNSHITAHLRPDLQIGKLNAQPRRGFCLFVCF